MRKVLRRLALVAVGLGVGAGLLEAALRLSGRSVRTQASLFEVSAQGTLGLQACGHDLLRGPDGRVTDLATDASALRSDRPCLPTPAADTLVLGDSQVFGLGVAASEAFPARIGALNGGVPDFAVGDALDWGDSRLALRALAPVRRVVVVVNQSNDFEDALRPSAERNVVRSGYLLRRDRLTTPGAFLWGTPLARSALFYMVWGRRAAPPADPPGAWMANPESIVGLAEALGQEVRRFADRHPSVDVELAWLPADLATSEANARASRLYSRGDAAALRLWENPTLRDALASGWGAPIVDLGPALTARGSFLAHDFHLGERGHARVAEALASSTSGQ
jgi:hypothetical protein